MVALAVGVAATRLPNLASAILFGPLAEHFPSLGFPSKLRSCLIRVSLGRLFWKAVESWMEGEPSVAC